jgi:hypothetical protein
VLPRVKPVAAAGEESWMSLPAWVMVSVGGAKLSPDGVTMSNHSVPVVL